MSDAYQYGPSENQLQTITTMIAERRLDFVTVRKLVQEISGFSGHPDTLSFGEASRFITRLGQFPKVSGE